LRSVPKNRRIVIATRWFMLSAPFSYLKWYAVNQCLITEAFSPSFSSNRLEQHSLATCSRAFQTSAFRPNISYSFSSKAAASQTESHFFAQPKIKSPHKLINQNSHSFSMSTEKRIVSISDSYDGGNIEYIGSETKDDGCLFIKLKIRPDPFTELEQKSHLQYFSFRALVQLSSTLPSPRKITYQIINAGQASYAVAWPGSTVFTSNNINGGWKRLQNTCYDSDTGILHWTVDGTTLIGGNNYYAYFPPYTYERHLNLISKCCSAAHNDSIRCQVKSLGQTLDGKDMECITIGSGKSIAWIIHRQHPGETMAEFFAEGLLTRLLGLSYNGDELNGGSVDGLTKKALEMYTFHIVPNMCPDGGVRGHLRTNACGANLNREWASSEGYEAPTLERSPEVYHTLKAMDKTGVDVFVDVHGDEALPFNFIAGSEGCPNWGKRLESLQGAFVASYARANSDMQTKVSYEPDEPNQGKLTICSNQVSVRFDCLSVTLEQPFKDCKSNPDPDRGWNDRRAMLLGASLLDPLVYVQPFLRDEGSFWESMQDMDAYIRPTEKY